jgi:deferrochelatase/peroxidase EfeB
MGRWQDGTPLVVRPGAESDDDSDQDDRPENDFSYATDDPQGLHCPFGAHIRRANPRDSLQPEDPDQQSITNRHRLLRRGRTYEYESASDPKPHQGLMFTSLCADLERQFEFVQQTWIGSPAFHGLKDEVDPIAASQDGKAGVFTIPTPSGPLRLHDMQSFVTVRGGGYFFLPSLSAMLYLFDQNQD